jgi:hypothetical protein
MSTQWHAARHNRAQEFLNYFVRQNEADLVHITCNENLLPIKLDAAHHAVYLELSQHLISQQMQIKKMSKKSMSDRSGRVDESLNGSESAEEALVNSALFRDSRWGVRIGTLDYREDKTTSQRQGRTLEVTDGA